MPAELRLAAAIHWYQQGSLSMERAAEAAGLTRADFLGELARRRVDVFGVDDEDLRRELGTPEVPCRGGRSIVPFRRIRPWC